MNFDIEADAGWYPCRRVQGITELLTPPAAKARYNRLTDEPLESVGAVLTWLIEQGHVVRVDSPHAGDNEPVYMGWGTEYFAVHADKFDD
jgi:hypothetical protein